MSDAATEFLPMLGRTTLWLLLAGLTTATILHLARATWPAAHRIGWVVTLVVGWTFLRLPIVIPWYDDTASRSVSFPSSEVVASSAAIEAESAPPARAIENLAPPHGISPGKAFPGLDQFPKISNPPGSRFDWPLAALVGWGLGVIGLVAAWLIGYLRFVRSLPSGLPADEAWLDQWGKLLLASGVSRAIPLRVTTDLGPMLCRLPRGYELLVPADLWRELEIGQRGAILRHELAHYLRGDVWKSLAARVLALPHWFNPVSWWAVRRFEEAAEWACDRAATAEEPPTTYAKALVLLGAAATGPAAYGSAARGPALAVRIRRLLNLQAKEDSTMKKTLLIATALCLAALSLVRLQLVAKEPGAADNGSVETKEFDTPESDPTDTTLATTGESVESTRPLTEAEQLQKKMAAEQLVKAIERRSELADKLFRAKWRLAIAVARNKNPQKGPSDAVIDPLLNQDPHIAQANDRLELLRKQLAEEQVRGVSDDDPSWTGLRQKTQQLEKRIAGWKAESRSQLLELAMAPPNEDEQPVSTLLMLEKEKQYLAMALQEADRSVQEKASELQKLEKFSAEVASQRERSVEKGTIAAQAVEARGEIAAAAQPAKASAVTAAAKKMVEEAQRAFEATRAAFDAETTTLSRVHEWSLTWREAAESAAREPKQIVEAAKAHLERVRNVQTKIKALYDAHSRGGEAEEMAAANFYVAEAERHLAEAEANARPPVKAEQARTKVQPIVRIHTDEVQPPHLVKKLAEIDGKLQATVTRLQETDKALKRKQLSEDERARLWGDLLKLDAEKKSLRKQKDAALREAGMLPASSYPVSKTQPAEDKPSLRYNGKDFNAWTEELRDDLSPQRRKEAIQALATFGANGYGPQAGAIIIEAMRGYSIWREDTEEGLVATVARSAFAKIPPDDGLPLVKEALKSDNANQRLFALAVLPNLFSQRRDAMPMLLEKVKDPDAKIRMYAVTTIAAIDPTQPELLPVLREALGSEDRKVVGWAFGLIRRSTNPVVPPGAMWASAPALVPELAGLLHSTDDQIKETAANTLIEVGPEAIPELEKAIAAEGNPPKATKAEEVLKLIRERAAKEQK